MKLKFWLAVVALPITLGVLALYVPVTGGDNPLVGFACWLLAPLSGIGIAHMPNNKWSWILGILGCLSYTALLIAVLINGFGDVAFTIFESMSLPLFLMGFGFGRLQREHWKTHSTSLLEHMMQVSRKKD